MIHDSRPPLHPWLISVISQYAGCTTITACWLAGWLAACLWSGYSCVMQSGPPTHQKVTHLARPATPATRQVVLCEVYDYLRRAGSSWIQQL